MEETGPRHLVVQIANILDKERLSYFLSGGMAVLVWGRPRFTADIDIIVELTSADIDRLIVALRSIHSESYIEKTAVLEALNNDGEFNFIDGDTGIKVDFWILKKSPFDASRLKRRVAKKILNSSVYFIAPEDLIVSKLLWYEKSRSTRHLEDIESVFKISGNLLDRLYINKWAKKLGVENLLKNFSGETKF